MSFATYSGGNRNPRNVVLEAELFDAITPDIVIDQVYDKLSVPSKEGDTFMWQRLIIPTNIIAQLTEGASPAGRTVQYQTVSKTAEEYGETYSASSRAVELGQTDIVKHQAEVLKQLVLRTREQIGWQTSYSGVNVLYNSSAVTTRGAVNGAITGGRLELAIRMLNSNNAVPYTEATKGSPMDSTTPVERGFFCLCHPNAQADIRLLSGFVPAPNAGGMKSPTGYFGTWRNIHFINSSEFKPIEGAGAAVGATGMLSVGSVNVDVYPFVICGKGALGRLSIKGMDKGGTGGIKAYTVSGADHADPLAQRIISGARYWDGCLVKQDDHLIRIEAGVSAAPLA